MMDKKEVKGIADVEAAKAVKGHESRMHPGAKKMKAGGPTTDDRMKYGKNMSRAMNQRSGARGR
jgi:hypothetical protein